MTIPTPHQNLNRLFAASTVAVGTAGAVAVAYFNPTTAGFFPKCPFHSLTGLNCPGCGLTRSFHSLFNGHFAEALQYNLLMPFYLALFGYLFVSLVLIVWRGYGLKVDLIRPAYLWTFLICSLGFGVLRNIPLYPLTLFSP